MSITDSDGENRVNVFFSRRFYTEIVELLTNVGVDVNVKDTGEKTALMYASKGRFYRNSPSTWLKQMQM